MNVVQKVKEFIVSFNAQYLRWAMLVVAGILFLVMALLMYNFYSRLGTAQKKIQRTNQLRQETRSILERHERVKQQQNEVNRILEQDPTFKIKEYFTGIVGQLGMSQQNTKQEVSDPQDLENGYSEIKLDASFTDINTKQLTDLLYKIEQNERIYTKELIVTKSLKSPTIDVTLIIATLQLKTP